MFFSHIIRFLNPNTSIKNKRKILLIGAGDTGQTILRQTLQKSISPIEIVGFLDDNPKKVGKEIASKKKDSNKADAILIASFYHETYKFEE